MEIHKPKAAHNWREFLIEIGTIICGILIALSLEQVIDHFREQKLADEAREAVRQEVREDLYWMGWRDVREDCIRKRLTDLTDILAKARLGQSYSVPRHLGLLPHVKLTDERWLSNGHAGRTSLFPAAEQAVFGNMYFTIADLKAAQSDEETAWSKLRAIEGLDRMTPAEAHDFRVLVAQARYDNYMVLLGIQRARQWAAQLRLSPDGAESSRVATFRHAPAYSELCQPISAQRDLKALAVTDDPIGKPEDLP